MADASVPCRTATVYFTYLSNWYWHEGTNLDIADWEPCSGGAEPCKIGEFLHEAYGVPAAQWDDVPNSDVTAMSAQGAAQFLIEEGFTETHFNTEVIKGAKPNSKWWFVMQKCTNLLQKASAGDAKNPALQASLRDTAREALVCTLQERQADDANDRVAITIQIFHDLGVDASMQDPQPKTDVTERSYPAVDVMGTFTTIREAAGGTLDEGQADLLDNFEKYYSDYLDPDAEVDHHKLIQTIRVQLNRLWSTDFTC
jgi:hypothetical protein